MRRKRHPITAKDIEAGDVWESLGCKRTILGIDEEGKLRVATEVAIEFETFRLWVYRSRAIRKDDA